MLLRISIGIRRDVYMKKQPLLFAAAVFSSGEAKRLPGFGEPHNLSDGPLVFLVNFRSDGFLVQGDDGLRNGKSVVLEQIDFQPDIYKVSLRVKIEIHKITGRIPVRPEHIAGSIRVCQRIQIGNIMLDKQETGKPGFLETRGHTFLPDIRLWIARVAFSVEYPIINIQGGILLP